MWLRVPCVGYRSVCTQVDDSPEDGADWSQAGKLKAYQRCRSCSSCAINRVLQVRRRGGAGERAAGEALRLLIRFLQIVWLDC
jgi:hypothetical protein